MAMTIRNATRTDCGTVLNFIRNLADYEQLSHEVIATEALLEQEVFAPNSHVRVLIAEWHNQPVGFALFFYNFSTFLSRKGIYLEDLFVLPEMRGKGVGKALLKRIAEIAVENQCGRVEWSVLDWNKPAIEFYESIGAKPMDEWTTYRLTGEKLIEFAK